MNVNLPKKEKVSKKRITIYSIVMVACIVAIIIAISIQVLGEDVVNSMFGINRLVKRTEQEENVLKSDFEYIFDNKLENARNYNIQMIDDSKELVYTCYEIKEKTDKYEISIDLPCINIENAEVQKFNKEISNTYKAKAEEVLKGNTENIIYTVKYKANIEVSNILSVIVYSDLKQGTNAQRVIIQTFNFDLSNKSKIEISEVIKKYDLDKDEIQNKINNDITKMQKKYDELKLLGYNVFSRDVKSNIYKIENINEFFIYKNNIYIIFAYGNEQLTSEKDIVII